MLSLSLAPAHPPSVSLLTTCCLCDPQIGYGTTENSPVTFCANPGDNMERKSETVGFIMDHLEVPQIMPFSKKNIDADDGCLKYFVNA